MRWFVEVASLSAQGRADRLTFEAPTWQAALAQARAKLGDAGPLASFTIEVMPDGYRATNALARIRYSVTRAPDDAPVTGAPVAPVSPPVSPPIVAPTTTPMIAHAHSAATEADAVVARRPAATVPSTPAAKVANAIAPGASTPSASTSANSSGAHASAASVAAAVLGSARKPAKTMTAGSGNMMQDANVAIEATPAPRSVGVVPMPSSAPVPLVTPSQTGATNRPPAPTSAATMPTVREPVAGASAAARAAKTTVESGSMPPPPAAPNVAAHAAHAAHAAPSAAPLDDDDAPLTEIPSAERGRVFHRRAEDPSDRSPLTYREAAISIAGGASLDKAVRIGRSHLDDLRAELDRAGAPTGRFVQLAVFDHEWQGRPEHPALVTLTWKDWRGNEPHVIFPAQVIAAREPLAPTPPASPVARLAVHAPSAPMASDAPLSSTSGPPTDVARPFPFSFPAGAVRESALPPSVVTSAPPLAAFAPAYAPAVPAPTPQPAHVTATPLPSARRRPDDLMTEIFERMHDLQFLRDGLEGAEFVVSLLREKIPTHVAFFYFYDINTKEFVIVKSTAPRPGTDGLRVTEAGDLVGDVVRAFKTRVVDFASMEPRWGRARYEVAGHTPQQIVVAPIRQARRFLGAVEIADHVDGGTLNEGEVNALTYIGEQLSEFLADRGVSLHGDTTTGPQPVIRAR